MEHNMLKEIKEQPEILRRLVGSVYIQAFKDAVLAIQESVKSDGQVIFLGNGSSYHSCIYGQYLFSISNHIMVNIFDTAEFEPFIDNLGHNSTVIIVSQSGETGDALEIISKIRQKSKIISITNNLQSKLAKEADISIDLMLGETNAIPSTKGYTAEMATFALLSDGIKKSQNFAGKVEKIATEMKRIIFSEHDQIRTLSDKLKNHQLMYILGHSIGLSNAYETALKIKECAHIQAEGYSGPEFRHGPSSMVGFGTPVVVFAPDIESEEDLKSAVGEVKHSGGYVIEVGAEHNLHYDLHIKTIDDYLYSPFAAIVPLQMLAFELAMAKGLDPDEPSGVRKVVS
jgi:glucosamine--fructose-6-phosphate aminotransferase (isomerizing)